MAAQIDYVVYSCDFPSRVSLQTLFPDAKFDLPTRPWASITGATYLWKYVRDKNSAMMLPIVNWYVSPGGRDNLGKCQKLENVKSRGFHATTFWTSDGGTTKDRSEGQTYLLSTMLGVTRGRGNTVEEVLSYLERSAPADGTHPRGTFYYMKNNNIRSQMRHDCYNTAAAEFESNWRIGRSRAGRAPAGREARARHHDGYRHIDFAESESTLLPGAICDNLTSFGGDLDATDQAKLRSANSFAHGAAGASGTVFEPAGIQSKFPLPSLFIHYARGCSLAESFYQSVSGPYILLVVGDPLCQPFADLPKVTVEGIKPGQEVKGTLPIEATAMTRPPERVGDLELFVDGRLVARFVPAGRINSTRPSCPMVITNCGSLR